MTELENTIIDPLINDNIRKLYSRFVADTLLVVQAEQIPRIQNLRNQFDHNLQFTMDTLPSLIVGGGGSNNWGGGGRYLE